MAIVQRNDPGCGTGSTLVDLSSTDATWAVATVAIPRQLFVEGAGDVKFTGADGNTDTWTVPANSFVPCQVVKISKTGTTATRIHAIY